MGRAKDLHYAETSMTKASNTELVETQAHFRFPYQVVLPLPDDFVHAGVGEEWLIKFIVAPLPVAQQVYYHIPAELALVLDSQSCGTDNFFRIISIYVDNSTSNNFTCPGVENIMSNYTRPLPKKVDIQLLC